VGRLAKLPPYLFSEIDAARRRAEARGRDVVDLGIGDPDQPTPAVLVQAMTKAVSKTIYHRYPVNQGSQPLRETITNWFERLYGVQIDPERHVQVLIGSKEGLAHLPLALLEEGDEVLVPDPGYPVYTQATILAGGRPVPFQLQALDRFRPTLAKLTELVSRRTRLLYLNYPNNPTGATANADLLRSIATWCAERDLVLAHDAAYLEVVLNGARPACLLANSDLEKQRVIEFFSLSKMFNMTGWRIGFAVGHEELIRDLGRVKESIDSGVFTAIQEVAIRALGDEFEDLIKQVMSVYPSRREAIVAALTRSGIEVFPARNSFYVWARVPNGGESLSFCRRVLEEIDVLVTPGIGFGPGGEGWFRISLTASDERIATAAERLGRL